MAMLKATLAGEGTRSLNWMLSMIIEDLHGSKIAAAFYDIRCPF
jgi:hypothetical protein